MVRRAQIILTTHLQISRGGSSMIDSFKINKFLIIITYATLDCNVFNKKFKIALLVF